MLKFLLSILVPVVSLAAYTQSAHAADPYTRDIKILSKWFEGEFDNSEQLWFQNYIGRGKPETKLYTRVHTTHIRMDAPELGEHVFYVEEYMEHDPSNIGRQRIVIFSLDGSETGVRMQQGFFKDAKSVVGGKNLEKLTASDVFFLDECDVFWTRDGGQFKGSMKPKACVFGEGEKRRYSVHDLTLSQEQYWRVDTTFLVSDDSLHVGEPVDKPFKLKRAHRYECGVTFKETPASKPYQEIENLSVHSEGGTVDFADKETGKEYTVLVREKEYPFYDSRPNFLYFSLREKDAKQSLVFSVNDLDSRRMGITLGGMGVHCHREGYTFDESLDVLNLE